MRFCPDSEQPGWFYIDRGVDDRADHFKPCGPCSDRLEEVGRSGEIWFKAELCGPCYTANETLGDIADAADERIQIMDPVREPLPLPDYVTLPCDRRPDDNPVLGLSFDMMGL